MKIVLLPLDDRPCNLYFPKILPYGRDKVSIAPSQVMGNQKRSADISGVQKWLFDECKDADYLIMALDTLIYGGLIPSRLHHKSKEELINNLDFVKKIREAYPSLKIFAFLTIMRTPNSNFDSEEPLYWKRHGKRIFRLGQLIHKEKMNIITDEEKKELKELKNIIPYKTVRDYRDRRKVNLEVLHHAYDLYRENYFDYFYIPQDDSNPYGFTRLDQMEIIEYINKCKKPVKIFPGADEVGLVMVARAINEFYNRHPKVYVYYASCKGPFVVPSFEDRMIDSTINDQILSIGGIRVNSLSECDFVLAINIGGDMLYFPNEEERIIPYDIERNLADFINYIKYVKSLGKVIGVCDVAIPTGSDFELVNLLRKEGLMLKIDGYASWNTASNTIGTVLSELSCYTNSHSYKKNLKFLIHRYYDDLGYCSFTRTWTDINAALARGYSEARLDGKRGKITRMCKAKLLSYMKEEYTEVSKYVEDITVTSPWNRSFEMQFTIKYNEKMMKK